MDGQGKIKLACEISSISVFREILNTETFSALTEFLSCGGSTEQKLSLYGKFVYSLAGYDYSFSDFLCRKVFTDENRYVILSAKGADIPPSLKENAVSELELFTRLTDIDSQSLCASLSYDGYIPQFENSHIDFVSEYAERLKNISRCGYGIFAGSKMFRVEGNDIVPVSAADNVSEADFVGYENERKQVFDNTLALIEGRPAANVLLFGDAGTGKSSTVKACVNHFADRGVRLIEIRKDQLFDIPAVMERIYNNPLKFIIFIDDLSFNKNDDSFSMLKAALEGSATASAENAVIYATSNRRHIIKETFSDRAAGDDIHHNDTVQELMSLSDRFGLTVYFEKPDKKLYLEIVKSLAEKYGVKTSADELSIKAEAFALAKGSRSPRAAEQFVRSLLKDGK